MERIKIITVPSGEAPLEVRQAWVGCVFEEALPSEGCEVGNVTQAPQPKRKTFLVKAADALKVLEQRDPSATQWFRTTLGERVFSEFLAFGQDEARVLHAPLPFRYNPAELE